MTALPRDVVSILDSLPIDVSGYSAVAFSMLPFVAPIGQKGFLTGVT